jgi:branched-chain amino acid transport system permease protein
MEYIIHLAIISGIFSILALSLNLLVGYTGLLSVTHAAFYGVGAYTTALLMRNFGMNYFLTVVLAIIITAIVALLIGLILSRFKEDYYALVSLGFNIILFGVLLNWQELTRGPLGIPGISRPDIFGLEFSSSFSFLILTLVFLGLIYYFSRFIINSSFGRVLKAIREDETAAKVFGYNTSYFKLSVFVITAGMAAVAGTLFASYISFIDPHSFNVEESIFLLSVVILGGLASLRGAILGAVVLVLLPELLRFAGFPPEIAGQMRQLIYGLLLIVLMLYRPQGFLGKFRF